MKKNRSGGPCVFDEAFKRMAVELSYANSALQEDARQLGVDSSRVTKWRRSAAAAKPQKP